MNNRRARRSKMTDSFNPVQEPSKKRVPDQKQVSTMDYKPAKNKKIKRFV